ncbi:hypothetical protein [Leptospira levettii]|uniref:hypothetical protein n=1 Tax=Leptospira levettii TaxID=2023178 RepID=UPI003EBA85D8
MYEKWIAVGDIHSSFNNLSIIVRKIKDFPEHKLIFLGDYIDDYGKHLGNVLDTFMALEKPAIFLKGNHEEEFLNFYSKYGTNDKKRRKILNHFGLGIDHLDWLRNNLVYSYRNEKAYFSHAGIDDSKSLEEQTEYDLIYSAFRENLDHVDDKLIFVQGHIPFHSVRYFGNHWFIDTGCGLGGFLSAFVFPEMEIITSKIVFP